MRSCAVGSDRVFGPRVDSDCRPFDFTIYFEDLILFCLPATLFIVLLPLRAFILSKQKARSSLFRPRLLAAKLIVLASLFFAHLIWLSLRLHEYLFATNASLVTDVLDTTATILALILSFLEERRSLRPSTLLGLYFSAAVISNAIRVRTTWLVAALSPMAVVGTINLSLTLVALVFESIERSRHSLPQLKAFSPDQLSGIWNSTIFAWLLPVLRAGSSSILSVDDLPILDTKLESEFLRNQLVWTWAQYDCRKPGTLLRACFRAFSFPVLYPVPARLCLTAFTFVQPLLINTTVKYIGRTDPDQDSSYAKGLVGAWALVYLGITISISIYQHQNFRFVTRLRGGLTAMVYQRSIRTKAYDAGEIAATTLMTTDVERLVSNMQFFHEIWASVIDIVLATWLLGQQLSVACLAPIVAVIVFIGIMAKFSAPMSAAQVHWLERVPKRIRATSVMLNGIKAVRILGLSDIASGVITSLRMSEIKSSAAYRRLMAVIVLLSVIPMNLAPVLTFVVYAVVAKFWKHEVLLTAQALTAAVLITLLTAPLLIFIRTLPMVVQCFAIFDRIQEFCNYGMQPDGEHTTSASQPTECSLDYRKHDSIEISHRSFCWHRAQSAFLNDVNVNIPKGSITAIVGPVGSGKSAFLLGLLGEMIPLSTTHSETSLRPPEWCLTGAAAYCAHKPWLENRTVRQNIIGVSLLDEEWYSSVRSLCELNVDLDKLEEGDQTLVGSDGINLSGGQKQRIALARAIYSRREIVLLDDVFSGVDAHTANFISENLLGHQGLFRKNRATVIMVTNNEKIMLLADKVIVLDNGSIAETGSPRDLLEDGGYINKIGFKMSSHNLGAEEDSQKDGLNHFAANLQSSKGKKQAEVDLIDWRRKKGDTAVYHYYFASAGYGLVVSVCSFCTLWIFCTEFSPVILKWWSEANARTPNHNLAMWISVYTILGLTGVLASFAAGWFGIVSLISSSAANLHSDLLKTTFEASYRFLTATDHGELLNRFSQDVELIDMELPVTLMNYMSTACTCIIKLVILAIFSQYLGLMVPIGMIVIYFIQSFYLKTSRQLRLLHIEARAPLLTHFTESSSGAITIRAFGWQRHYDERNCHLIDRAQRPAYIQNCVQNWLGVVLNLTVAGLAVILVATVLTWRDKFSPGSVGVSLVVIVTFNEAVVRLVQVWTSLETSIGAVARILQFTRESELEDATNRTVGVRPDWPSIGSVEFKNLTASYSKFQTNAALKNVSISVNPGQHVAICGRTGSGKTSLLLTLMQMIEVQSGQGLVDDVDLSTIAYADVRKHLNVVPQDPIFIPGTLRFNIDPFQQASEAEVLQALARVGLRDTVHHQGGLDVEMNTATWSDGQRQLLCLARAMVRKGRVLILDEAMSSVDSETEAKMQEIIDTEFKHHTVLAVMHRLKHISRYDMVAFLSDGQVLEYDTPATLLEGSTQFAGLYRAYKR